MASGPSSGTGTSGTGSTGSAPAAADTAPPVITLGNATCAGTGSAGVANTRATTAGGVEVVLTSVPVGEHHAGPARRSKRCAACRTCSTHATCNPLPSIAGCAFVDSYSVWDAADGNLTAGASTFGAAAVDTSSPTPAAQPFLIMYQASDAAGNTAAAKQRRMEVVCPAGESVCSGGARLAATLSGRALDTRSYCSTHGMCLGAPPPPADSSGSAAAAAPLPTLQLVGPTAAYLPVGQSYAACPASPPADLACDRGATAWQQEDGSLTAYVEACSTPTSRHLFAVTGATCSSAFGARTWLAGAMHPTLATLPTPLPCLAARPAGLAGCNISTAAPAVLNLTFSVQDSLGRSAAASRMLYVQQHCPAGERRCEDQVIWLGKGAWFRPCAHATGNCFVLCGPWCAFFPSASADQLQYGRHVPG